MTSVPCSPHKRLCLGEKKNPTQRSRSKRTEQGRGCSAEWRNCSNASRLVSLTVHVCHSLSLFFHQQERELWRVVVNNKPIGTRNVKGLTVLSKHLLCNLNISLLPSLSTIFYNTVILSWKSTYRFIWGSSLYRTTHDHSLATSMQVEISFHAHSLTVVSSDECAGLQEVMYVVVSIVQSGIRSLWNVAIYTLSLVAFHLKTHTQYHRTTKVSTLYFPYL